MKDQVKTLRLVQFVNGPHKAILILVIQLKLSDPGLGKEARVISDDIALGFLVKKVEVLMPDKI